MIPWYILAILSAIFSTLFILFRKKGVQKDNSLDFELTRGIFVIIFSLFLLVPFIKFNYSFISIILTIITAIIASIGIYLTTKTLHHAQLSEIAPLYNLTPGFLAILAFLFLGEKLNLYQISGIVILLIGAYVLETDGRGFWKTFCKHIKSIYAIYAIIAAFIFAITASLDKFIINNYLPPLEFLFLIWLFIGLTFIITSLIKKGNLRGFKDCLKKSKHNVILAAFFSLVASMFYVLALATGFVSLVIPIRRLSTLMNVWVGGEVFGEKGIWKKALATLIMIIGALLIILM